MDARDKKRRQWTGPAQLRDLALVASTPEKFVAWRSAAGYEWRLIKSNSARLVGEDTQALTPRTAANGQAQLTPYTPPKDLFLNLAQLPSDKDAILDFGNRLGSLGLLYRRARSADLANVELLSEWKEEIDELRQALTLWKALRDGDHQMLASLIRWSKNGDVVAYDTHAGTPFEAVSEGTRRTSALIASKGVHPELLAAFTVGDVLAPARAYLQRLVNENAMDLVRPQLRLSRELDRFEFHFVAYGVLGCAWLQFAEAVHDSKGYKQCTNPRCGKWMIISREGSGRRSTRRTCSAACRVMKGWLPRKAAELKREGMSMKAIAQRLNVDVGSVKRWIEMSRGGI